MPPESRIWATSCGWTPSTSNEMIPARCVGGRTEDTHVGELGKPAHRVLGELVLVALDRVEADGAQVVDRDPEPVGLRDRRRPGLVLVGQVGPARLGERDLPDHRAAELERRHGLQQLLPPPHTSDTARAEHLVAREGEEVAAERFHVDRPVRRSLARVDDHDRVALMRPGREVRHGADRAERVRDERRRDELDAAELLDLRKGLEDQLAAGVDRDGGERRSGALRDVLPGNEVRVVLELGGDSHVTGAEVVEAPRVRDEVQSLGAVPREDDLPGRARAQKRAHFLARSLVACGRPLAEDVDGAVNVRVGGLVELPHGVQHLTRLLRGVGGVQVRERLAVDLERERGEVGTEPTGVQARDRCGLGHHPMLPAAAASAWVLPGSGRSGRR